MISFVLKLLGVRIDSAHRVADWSLAFRSGISPWWILLLAIVLAAGVVWLYRRAGDHLSAWRKYLLAAMRVAFLLLILGLLLRPVLTLTVEGSVRQSLAMLFDTSASMKIEDARTDEADLKRVAIAKNLVDPAGGLDQPLDASRRDELAGVSRIDVLKAVLKNPKLDLVQALAHEYDLRPYTFDAEVSEQPVIRLAAPDEARQVRYHLWAWALMIASAMSVVAVWFYIRQTSRLGAQEKRRLIAYRWSLAGVLVVLGLVPLAMVMWEDALEQRLGLRQEQLVIEDPSGQQADRASGPARRVPLDWVDRLDARGASTAGGDALRKVIADLSGQPVAGIFMAWDGASNSGIPALAAADYARQEGLPLFIYGVGVAQARDIIVSNIFAPQTAFADEELPITVRVRSRGLKDQSAVLKVELAPAATGSDDPQAPRPHVLVEQPIVLEDGEQVVAVKLATPKIAPARQVELELRAYIDPREDETVKDNNATTHHLRVVDGKIRVLYVEQQPRWEFRYLQAMLLRDRRIELRCVLIEGDRGIAAIEDSPYLERFPVEARELADYNLIILGDVDPRHLATAQLEMIEQFVSKLGGGLLVIAGRNHMPHAYRRSVLENLLPVELDSGTAPARGASSGADQGEKPIYAELTSAGRDATMLRLSDHPGESEKRWSELPPVYWVARVLAAKPAAEVLLVDPDPAKSSRFGKLPVMAIHQYGLGQVLYVGTDNTWRWRRNSPGGGAQYYTRLWGQIVQRLTLPSLLGQSKLTQLTSDRQSYVAFERVTVFARLYDENLRPVEAQSVRGYYQAGDQRPQQIELTALPAQRGMYRGEFIPLQSGTFKFWVERDPQTQLDIVVGEPRIELAESAMQEQTLRQMAQTTGGAFFREEDLHALPQQVRMEARKVQSPLEVELGFSPLWFIAMVMVVTGEWILRKVCQLK